MSKKKRPDKDVVEKYVGLQARTPCRKCKKTDWTLEPDFGISHGGARVGIFGLTVNGARINLTFSIHPERSPDTGESARFLPRSYP